ncbi:hypothetical protein DCAR_0623629 [Daucus carota subsp. sativus]|uniref:Uncharacterized protein n=1 Tax=Daucus carota subsp. sativus TaxID=79200 RepID=A0A164VBU6_DAUCS|nr:PREDICTED: 2S sulfur-rich seed storage protein 2-like [Daucus carota subsp. sativus]WOH04220.1 hypothetical protein DCAR_0623629 [Daucus carota subsp. sativus]
MANLKLFGALLIALFAVATATTYTTTVTTITTTTEDEGSSSQQGSRQQCREEIQGKDFNMCERFLIPDQQQGGGSLRMIVQSDEGKQRREEQQELQTQCCEELKQIKPMCRCAAIGDVVKQQMEGGQSMQSKKMRQMLQKAQNLPSRCKFDQPQECSFGQTYWIA